MSEFAIEDMRSWVQENNLIAPFIVRLDGGKQCGLKLARLSLKAITALIPCLRLRQSLLGAVPPNVTS